MLFRSLSDPAHEGVGLQPGREGRVRCSAWLGGAVLFIGIGSIWFGEPAETWRHLVSRCLIWASIPVGIILALVARRFSIVQGVAGGDGYDELHETDDKKPVA